jgi:hypothetical protein
VSASRLAIAGLAVAAVAAAVVLGLRWRSQSQPLCVRASEIFCDKLEGCGGLDPRQRRACVEHHARDCETDLGWKVRRGVLVLDAEAEEECLEALGDAQCNQVAFVMGDDEQDVFELTDRCEMEELLRPDAGLGAPCGLPSDCKEGSCPYAEPGCHVCRPFVGLGAPCSIGGDACDPKVAQCEGGRCVSPLDAGSAPVRVKAGEACTAESVCAEPEARCVGGRCLVRPFVIAEGQACADFTDCQVGLYCRSGVCAPQAPVGGECAAKDYGSCRADARCVEGRCVPLGREGQACAGPFQCKAELDCVPDSSDAGYAAGAHCLSPAELGEGCGPYRSCHRGFCRDGRCTPWLAGGEACTADSQCASEGCIRGRCNPVCGR